MTKPVVTKTYVLDTSVLLSDPNAIRSFAEHEVIVPVIVIRELEKKRDDPTLGHNARTVLRSLEALRVDHGADLRSGVTVNESGGTVRIEINHVDSSHLPDSVRADKGNDTRILSVADALRREGRDVVVVSKDLPLRLLAHGALGIPAEEYRCEQVPDTGYSGLVEVETSRENVDELYSAGRIPLGGWCQTRSSRAAVTAGDVKAADPANGGAIGRVENVDSGRRGRRAAEQRFDTNHLESHDIPINTGVVLLSPTSSALGRVTANKEIEHVRGDLEAFGVHGRSAEQRIALAHLLDPSVGIVSLGGRAGTGKSVLALAAALELVLEQRAMRRIFVFRPIIAVGGQELGYLPGDEQEKMSPWGAAVFDALRSITTEDVIDEVRSRDLLEILPLTHIRGRTLGPNDMVLVDECQNLERSTILTAISRLGEGSKIVLLHDVGQRDSLRVGRHDGIAAVVERLKGEPLFAHVTLTRSERSPIAALATRLLDDGLH